MNLRKLNLSLSLIYTPTSNSNGFETNTYCSSTSVNDDIFTILYLYGIIYIYISAMTDGLGFIVNTAVDKNLYYIIAAVIILYIHIRI